MLVRNGDLTAAQREYEELTRADPNEPGILLALVDALVRQKDHERALAPARLAMQQAPDDPKTLLALAHCLESTGRKGESVPCYERLLEFGSMRRYALGKLTHLYAVLDRRQGAIDAGMELLSLTERENWVLSLHIARQHVALNDLDGAARCLWSALAAHPEEPEVPARLVPLLLESGQPEQARYLLRASRFLPATAQLALVVETCGSLRTSGSGRQAVCRSDLAVACHRAAALTQTSRQSSNGISCGTTKRMKRERCPTMMPGGPHTTDPGGCSASASRSVSIVAAGKQAPSTRLRRSSSWSVVPICWVLWTKILPPSSRSASSLRARKRSRCAILGRSAPARCGPR